MAKVGRRLKLTRELQDRLCNMLRQGAFRNRAAIACGIGESTLYRWLEAGTDHVVETPRGARKVKARQEFREFREAVDEAEAHAEQLLVQTIRQSAFEVTKDGAGNPLVVPKDWRAAAWMLERKHPKRWGPEPEAEGGVGGKVNVGNAKKVVVFGGRYKPGGGKLEAASLPDSKPSTSHPEPATARPPKAATGSADIDI